MPRPPYRMPAEWEPHSAVWVSWPSNPETWPGCLAEAEREFRGLVWALQAREPVCVLVQDAAHERAVREALGTLAEERHVRLHCVPSDDAWLRDTGPTFVHDAEGEVVALDWTFNAWGGKYPPWERDDAVASRVAELAGVSHVRENLVVEGGALEVDGAGTLLAARPTLLDAARNPALDEARLERRLAELLGVRRFIWLDSGIAGDDTDGHVDQVARFASPGRVLCAREPDSDDPNHEPLEQTAARLRGARDAAGRSLEVIDLPMPDPVEVQGARLPASYANFYLATGAVIVPVFDVPQDIEALDVLERAFPGRSVVPVLSRHLVRGQGSVHCLTQQQPAPRPRGA